MERLRAGFIRLTTETTLLSLGSPRHSAEQTLAQSLTRRAGTPLKGSGVNGEPTIYAFPLSEVGGKKTKRYRVFQFGKRNRAHKLHRVIMIVGETGSGKSTLINGMINYILGVQWEDNFRFKIEDELMSSPHRSQACSQTDGITAYTVHHQDGMKIDYTLTLIDTPGFGDTRGIDRDQAIMDQMREFFTSSEHHYIDHIDAIGFVAVASQARLTPTQKYVFDSILAIFGSDIAGNIMVLVTFADGDKPQVRNAIKAAGIPYVGKLCKFNNSVLFASNKDDANQGDSDDDDEVGENVNRIFWGMGQKSMGTFFYHLERMKEKSLTLTTQVLEERKRLEVTLSALQPQIAAGCSKIERLRKEEKILKQHETDIKANKEFHYQVADIFIEKIDVTGHFLTNCIKCHFTCHFPCIYDNDNDKDKCYAMTEGMCRVCPGKCIWKVHHNQKYRFEYKSVTVTKTYTELEKKYNEASGKKLSVQDIIAKLKKEFKIVQDCVCNLVEECRTSIQKLEAIALRPTIVSMAEYVDLLIEAEKKSSKSGWQDRVAALIRVRDNAEVIRKIQDEKYDPFQIYQTEFNATGLNDLWYK